MNEEHKQMPQGWVRTRLGEIVLERKEKVDPQDMPDAAYLSLEHVESVTNQIVDPGKAAEVISTKSRFSPGDVLYGKLRPYLNKVCMPGFAGVCSTDMIVFSPSNAIDKGFLLRLLSLRQTVDYANRHSKGINLPRVSPKQMALLPVDLPPLPEQRRIVAKIEELQARSRRAREALEAIPDLIEQFRQSVLAAAFRGDLTADWRDQQKREDRDLEPASKLLERILAERRKRWEDAELHKLKTKGLTGDKLTAGFAKRRKKYKTPTPPDTTNLPDLPDGWCWASVEQLSHRLDYGTSAKSANSGSVPVLRMGNLQHGEIDWTELVYTSDRNEISKYALAPGTVLFNRTNSPELVGKTSLYRGEKEAIHAGYLIAIRQVEGTNPSCLNVMLNSPFIKGLCQKVKTDGVSQSNINATKLASFPVPLCNEEEQGQVATLAEDALWAIQETGVRQQSLTDSLKQLDQSILAKAFRGELVPQDPNDEPASALLERIRQARENQVPKGKGRNPTNKPKDRGS